MSDKIYSLVHQYSCEDCGFVDDIRKYHDGLINWDLCASCAEEREKQESE